ncbi:hypothetical protein [Fodinicola feengrottensis]|uniref:hypothetical protein n=1 Tax=Fodinicola feengrottensis TaxID=435914 RepID=UPI0013D6E1A1|nr:hypothetical protein [Fodinicola feengrottensis]
MSQPNFPEQDPNYPAFGAQPYPADPSAGYAQPPGGFQPNPPPQPGMMPFSQVMAQANNRGAAANRRTTRGGALSGRFSPSRWWWVSSSAATTT